MHSPLVRADERAANDVGGLVVQAQVVQRELERLPRLGEKRCDQACDLERRLAALGQGVNLDQGCCFARSDALYARFFAW
jgi:hypothetical protein